MATWTLESFLKTESHRVIFRAITGSHAYGTNLVSSDHDTVGVFVMPAAYYLTADEPLRQVADERNDHRLYALKHFFELAREANPNLLDALFMPADCVLQESPYWAMVKARRSLFLSKVAAKSYGEYAFSQIKKARGQNKAVHNPQPLEPPKAEDFCRVIPLGKTAELPGRPMTLDAAGVALAECHVAAVEHTTSLFRLYHYGPQARGVFRNGMLVCESIPYDDERTRCVGLLHFNEQAFEHAKRQHRHYWTWRANRNEQRWQTQEAGLMDYDAKNMMHTFRLLSSGLHILREGKPLVRFSGAQREELLAIRRGAFSYDQLIEKATHLADELKTLKVHSALPETADKDAINALLMEVTERWENDHA